MNRPHTISLSSAVLININIMMGAGLFINTIELSKRAEFFGFLAYGLVGLLLLPLVTGIAHMVRIHPAGGFYTFAQREISPFAGFISAWSYFIGKLGSAALLIHVAISLLQQLIPILGTLPTVILDIVVITGFVFLNSYNLKTGKTIQAWLTALKITPILFVIIAGAWYLNPSSITIMAPSLSSFSSTIPLVLYAFLGFEAAVSLSGNIENAQRNGPRAIIISYVSVIALYMLYQLLVYISAGDQLAAQTSYLTMFPTIIQTLFASCSTYCTYLAQLLNCAIAASALGGSYGILFSNSWNLYTIAQHDHTFFAPFIRSKNNHQIPIVCVIIEGFICALYIITSQGLPVPLQLASALGSIIAYSLSIVALFYAHKHKQSDYRKEWIILALVSCCILISACIRNAFLGGIHHLGLFLTLLVAGLVMFFITSQSKRLQKQ